MIPQPLVSVVIPAFNVEKYINESIDSVLKQKYSNLEIIIIDDNSKDNTLSIIKSFNDKRIKYYSNKKNIGISSCLNKLIDYSTGEFICRMDADDIMHKDKIYLQMKFMLKNKLDFCGTWIKFFENENKIIKYPVSNIDIRYFMVFGCPFAHPSIIAKKEIFNSFKYEQTVAEDYHLWTRIAISSNNYNFGNLPKVLLSYRRHKDQLTEDNSAIVKDSISISNQYSKFYITNKKILDNITIQNFGMNYEYEFFDFYHFIKSMIFLAKKNKVSDHIVLKLITSIFFRIKKVKFINLYAFFWLLFKEKISLLNISIAKIITIFFLRKLIK